METLKRIAIAVVLIFGFYTAEAQNVQLQNAFKESYKLEKKGDFKKAADKIKAFYDEKSYPINLRLGWLMYNAGQFDESMAYYRKAIDLMPLSEEARFGYVLPLAAVGKWDIVKKQYEVILKNSPGNTTAAYRLGLIYYGKKDYKNAEKYFKKVVDLYPFGYDGLIMLAWTEYFLGKNREAKVLFNKVLLLSPDDKSAKEGLGLIK